ncbi:MAG: sigma-54-dependent Fis family transcriptional regulator [Myxococcales bacterium]|nr:sigma-54-dependent Fis family transcriptional regulator [Myxococcales bacterium]
MAHRILLVDDDPLALRLVARMLRARDIEVETSSSGDEALEILGRQPISALITDLVMDGMDGEELLLTAKRRHPTLPVVVMTTHGSIDTAVRLMQHGAADFVTKPVEPERLGRAVQRVLREAELHGEVAALRDALTRAAPDRQIVGDAPAFRALRERLPLAARSEAPVLILGETGTGKELVARAVHSLSPRSAAPMVAVNCGALPAELLDSELFGHVRGAFTDARRDKPGLVEEADGGTLFLDEIGDMPLPLQVKLLRFLQEGEVRRVGSNEAQRVDVRVVAATHRDLASGVDDGEFREDLYYRLSVVRLQVPPLRARKEDLPALARHLLARHAAATSRPVVQLAPDALSRLTAHDWPGNVRELENVLRRALVFCPGDVIDASLLEFDRAPSTPAGLPAPGERGVDLGVPLRQAKAALVDDFQQRYVLAALAQAGGVVAEAARLSGKDRKSFWELMQRYGIQADDAP